MKKLVLLSIILSTIPLSSCGFLKNKAEEIIIRKSCDLNGRLGQTVIIEGFFSACMESKTFQLIKKDRCYDEYRIDLEFAGKEMDKTFFKELNEMYICNEFRRLVVKGTIEKNGLGYGHLGVNNTKMTVLEIIEYDVIRFSKTK